MSSLDAETRRELGGLTSWDAYRAASRAGRGTPLGAKQKLLVWAVVERVRASLGAAGLLT